VAPGPLDEKRLASVLGAEPDNKTPLACNGDATPAV
jgi:hypothetical protein